VRGTAAGIRSGQLRFAGEFSHQRLQAAVAIRHGCEIAHLAPTLFGKRTKRNPGAYGGVLPGPYQGNRITELSGRRAGAGICSRESSLNQSHGEALVKVVVDLNRCRGYLSPRRLVARSPSSADRDRRHQRLRGLIASLAHEDSAFMGAEGQSAAALCGSRS
jgi:hypothetical protein